MEPWKYPPEFPPKIPPEYPPKRPPTQPPIVADAPCVVRVVEEGEGGAPTRIEICIPNTKDPLNPTKPQEPPLNAAKDGLGIYLHNGSFHYTDSDLFVHALGFPFYFIRHYRSALDYNGVMGLGWDHVYNQRVVPTKPVIARDTAFGWCETFAGKDGPASGDLFYYDGSGRRTFHEFESWDLRTIKECGGVYQAVVTKYKINPGERGELKRVAVVSGPLIWEEVIFYVRRNFDGALQIFNCYGYIIALLDANRNTMRFTYGDPLNPSTNYQVLRSIQDPSGNIYQLDYRIIGGIPRLWLLQDRWGRQVEFEHNAAAELISVKSDGGQHPENRKVYRYSGRAGLLREVVPAREAAQASQPSSIEVDYDPAERVLSQRVGSPPGVIPKSGGTYVFSYNGNVVDSVTGRRGTVVPVEMTPKHDTHVLGKRIVVNAAKPVPGLLRSEPPTFETNFVYDEDFQLKEITYPRGVREVFVYEPVNRPVTEGDERESVKDNITYFKDLSRGNLLEHHIISHVASEGEKVIVREYEHLLNRLTRITNSKGTTTFLYDNGRCATPEKNANPYEIVHSPLLNPDGSSSPVKEILTYRTGGLVETHTDPDGVVTRFDYHRSGAMSLRVEDPDGLALTTSIVCDDRGNPLFTKDPEQNVVVQLFDRRDNLETVIDPLGHIIRYRYDRNDRLIGTTEIIKDDPATFSYTNVADRTLTTEIEYDILDQVVAEVTDAGGLNLRRELGYDEEGNLVSDKSPRATPQSNLPGAVAEEPAAVIQRDYDSRGRLFSESYAPGHADESTTYYLYDPDGNPEFLITPEQGIWSFVYDGFGRPVTSRDPIGTVHQLTYSASGLTVRIRGFGPIGGPSPTDRSGQNNVLLSDRVISHNSHGDPIQTIEFDFDPRRGPQAGVQRVVLANFYKPSSRLEQTVDPTNRRVSYGYDTAGRLVDLTVPGGHHVHYTLRKDGLVKVEERTEMPEGNSFFNPPGPLQLAIERDYDALGRKIKETAPGVGAAEFAYDSRSLLRAVRRPTNGLQRFEYDAAGRQADQTVEVETNDFNTAGEIRVHVEHNRNGLPIEVTDGIGNTTRYRYDPLDRLREVTDPDAKSTSAQLNREGRPTLTTMRGGEQIEMDYDKAGRIQGRRHINSADPPNAPRQSFEFDGLSRLTLVRDSSPGGGDVVRGYNSTGWLKSETQNGSVVAYEHDEAGRPTAMIYPSGMRLEIDHSPSGRPASYSRLGYLFCEYSYLGSRVNERTVPTVLANPQDGSLVQFPLIRKYEYNPLGQLKNLSHLIHNDVTVSPPENIVVENSGDLNYDDTGRLVGKKTRLYGVEYRYDRADRIVKTITAPAYDRPGVSRAETTIDYDAAGNARRQTAIFSKTLGGEDRVTTETAPNVLNAPVERKETINTQPQTTTPIALTPSGNLFETAHSAPSPSDPDASLPAKRRLFYDAFGRVAFVFVETQDPNEDNWRITYGYDGLGRKTLRTVEQVRGPSNQVISFFQTQYLFSGNKCIEELERRSESDPWQPARRYYHGPGQNEVFGMDIREDYLGRDINNDGQVAGGTTLVFLDDHESTPAGLVRLEYHGARMRFLLERYYTGSSGQTTLFEIKDDGSFNAIRDSLTGHSFHQHGRILHKLEGLYYTGLRFYDPGLGIFVVRDAGGAWNDPLSFGNSYTYAANNTVMRYDPGGLSADGILGALYGFGKAILVGGLIIVAGVAAVAAGVISLPVLLGIGAVVLIGGLAYAAYRRISAGQSAGQVIGGSLADVTGISSIYAGIYNRDIASGAALGLSDFERGEAFGGGIGDLLLLAIGGRLARLGRATGYVARAEVAARRYDFGNGVGSIGEATPAPNSFLGRLSTLTRATLETDRLLGILEPEFAAVSKAVRASNKATLTAKGANQNDVNDLFKLLDQYPNAPAVKTALGNINHSVSGAALIAEEGLATKFPWTPRGKRGPDIVGSTLIWDVHPTAAFKPHVSRIIGNQSYGHVIPLFTDPVSGLPGILTGVLVAAMIQPGQRKR